MAGKDLTGFQQYMADWQQRQAAAQQQYQAANTLRAQIHTGGPLGWFTDRPSQIAQDAPARAALRALYAPAGAAGASKAATTPVTIAAKSAAEDAHNHGQAMTARDIQSLGAMSPAAQAVLKANSPLTFAAAHAAAQANQKPQPLGFQELVEAYGKANGGLSRDDLEALSGAAARTAAAQAAVTRTPNIRDIAGALALSHGQSLLDQGVASAQASGNKEAYRQAHLAFQAMLEELSGARAPDPTQPSFYDPNNGQ